MKGIIAHFRRGRKTQATNQMIVVVEGISTRENAAKLMGKEVVFTTSGKEKKHIAGKVTASHGNKGAVRVLFEQGMPGQAITKSVEVKG
jgi:large subunit ribosomal protein L35Ae